MARVGACAVTTPTSSWAPSRRVPTLSHFHLLGPHLLCSRMCADDDRNDLCQWRDAETITTNLSIEFQRNYLMNSIDWKVRIGKILMIRMGEGNNRSWIRLSLTTEKWCIFDILDDIGVRIGRVGTRMDELRPTSYRTYLVLWCWRTVVGTVRCMWSQTLMKNQRPWKDDDISTLFSVWALTCSKS